MMKSLLGIGKFGIIDEIFNDNDTIDQSADCLEEEDKVDHTSLFKIPKYLETVNYILKIFTKSLVHFFWDFNTC